jgi:hypothetical protein
MIGMPIALMTGIQIAEVTGEIEFLKIKPSDVLSINTILKD